MITVWQHWNGVTEPVRAEQVVINPAGEITIKLDSKVIAQAVVAYTLKKAARGPSALVGGSLARGGRVA